MGNQTLYSTPQIEIVELQTDTVVCQSGIEPNGNGVDFVWGN